MYPLETYPSEFSYNCQTLGLFTGVFDLVPDSLRFTIMKARPSGKLFETEPQTWLLQERIFCCLNLFFCVACYVCKFWKLTISHYVFSLCLGCLKSRTKYQRDHQSFRYTKRHILCCNLLRRALLDSLVGFRASKIPNKNYQHLPYTLAFLSQRRSPWKSPSMCTPPM